MSENELVCDKLEDVGWSEDHNERPVAQQKEGKTRFITVITVIYKWVTK